MVDKKHLYTQKDISGTTRDRERESARGKAKQKIYRRKISYFPFSYMQLYALYTKNSIQSE